MKVYRKVQGSQYHYYIEDEEETVLWYPEWTWFSRVVPQPSGDLLIEETEDHAMSQIRGLLPADLVEAIQQSSACSSNTNTTSI